MQSEFLDLLVRETREETPGCKSIMFEAANGREIIYKPGQFLTLVFNQKGRELRRSYSLSSVPGIDAFPGITVKYTPNGEISRYLVQHIEPGDKLQSLHPAGRFVIEDEPEPGALYYFFAAGSGIVPVYALLKHAILQRGLDCRLCYSNKNPNSALFRAQLQEMLLSHAGKFELVEIFSDAVSQHADTHLNNDIIERLMGDARLPEKSKMRFYVCGPPDYMRLCQLTLLYLGFDAEQIRREHFVINTVPFVPDIDRNTYKVKLKKNETFFEFETSYPDTILKSAIRNHIHLPYSCMGGQCSTCTVKLKSGTVKMSLNDVLTDKDIRNSLVLTCTGYAQSDLELVLD